MKMLQKINVGSLKYEVLESVGSIERNVCAHLSNEDLVLRSFKNLFGKWFQETQNGHTLQSCC